MRAALLCLLASAMIPRASRAAEPIWVRSLGVAAVEAPQGDPRGTWLASALNADPSLRACSEGLPPSPPEGAREQPVEVTLLLWEDGRVRTARWASQSPWSEDATACATAALERLVFPPAPDRSDTRSAVIRLRARWRAAALELLERPSNAPRLDAPEPQIVGRIDVVAIAAELDRLGPRLGRCVARRAAKVPDLGHRIDVKFALSREVTPRATTVRVDRMVVVDSDLGDERAEVCVLGVLGDVRWPAPFGADPVTIVWPFVFAH